MSGLLSSEARDMGLSKGELNSSRRLGKIPAVVFGKGMESVPVFVSLVEFKKMFDENGKVFDMKFGSTTETVNAKTIDTTPLGMVSHISFLKLTKGEATTVKVSVTIEGEALGVKAGGMIQQLEDTITIQALPKDIPDTIHVDVSALDIGQALTVGQIKLAKGLSVDDSEKDKIVVNCQAPQKVEEEAETTEAAPAETEAAPAGDAAESNES